MHSAPRKRSAGFQLLVAALGLAAIYGAVTGIELGLRKLAVEPGCQRVCAGQGAELREVYYTSEKYGRCFCRCTTGAEIRHAPGDWARGVSIPIFLLLVLVGAVMAALIARRRSKRG